MNILFTANELAPYAQSGELGEITASLPAALGRRGHSVSVAVPLHRAIREGIAKLKKTDLRLPVALRHHTMDVPVWQASLGKGVTLFALQKDEFFDRSNLYGNDEGDYTDNATRFSFFNRAVVELAKYIEPQVDVIHANDWHTALVPAYVRAWSLPFRTVLSIYDLAYQGNFAGCAFAATGLPGEYFSPEGIEFYDRVNFLKGGIMLAHAVAAANGAAVAEGDAFGLRGVLDANQHKLSSLAIKNGTVHISAPKKSKKGKSTPTATAKPRKPTKKQKMDTWAETYEKLYQDLLKQ